MPSLFDKLGLRFQYPDNWKLDVDDASAGQIAVTVSSPGGAFWSLTMHPRTEEPAELTDAVLTAMQQEYQGIEIEPASDTIGDQELTGYNMNFFYLDLTSTAQARAFRTPWHTLVIHCQAEDREFQRLEQVFRAITTSLVVSSAL